jgi:hypothetical protein
MTYLKWVASMVVLLLLGSSCLRAQSVDIASGTSDSGNGTSISAPVPKVAQAQAAAEKPKTPTDDINSQLKNFGFGVGLALEWNILNPPIINDATVDANGIVRVNTRANTSPSLLLEMHYIAKKFRNGDQGFGPFVAVQPGGNNQVMSSVGTDILYDWKLSTVTKKDGTVNTDKADANGDNASRKGFGLGFGYASIPAAKTLGDEFVPNTKAPVGPDGKPLAIRFETRDKGSIIMLLSFTF